MGGHVLDQASGPVTLHTGDDIVTSAIDAFRDDTEAVVLHGGGAADTAKKTLLYPPLEFDYCYTRGGLHWECQTCSCTWRGGLTVVISTGTRRMVNQGMAILRQRV